MDLSEYSGTAQFSEKQVEELKKPPDFNEVEAKLILTEEQENDLRQAFNLLDYTGEGKIKAEDFRVAIKALDSSDEIIQLWDSRVVDMVSKEIAVCVRPMSSVILEPASDHRKKGASFLLYGYEPTKEELQNMVQGVDKGDTGKMSFENFETAIMRKIMARDSDGDIMKSFRLFDTDDSGFISSENIKRVSEILGHYLTDEEIEEMVDDADKDFDGLISAAEYMKMIKNCVHIVTP